MAAENPAAAVLDRCDIKPSLDTAAEITLPLLHCDITWMYFHPVQRLLFFDFPCSKPQFLETLVPKLKQSLRQTIDHFLPLAGNIIHPLDSRSPFIRYSAGDSVQLTIAESSSDFDHLTGNQSREADEFYVCVPQLPPAKHSPNDIVFPALALQVTLFPNRGLCLGFTNHHSIGDASTIVRFIKSWASANESGSIDDKLAPVYDRTAVADPEGLDKIYWNLIRRSSTLKSPPIIFPLKKHRRTFVLTGEDIQKLKNAVVRKQPGNHITTFTVTSGLVWSCLVKAETAEVADDEMELFGFAANCRGRLKPPLPAAYFGNCLTLVKAESKHGLLKGKDGFLSAVECIGEAIQSTVYNEKGILHGAESLPLEIEKLIGKRLFGVAGSPRFDLYDVDYGWGRPNKFESVSIDRDTSMSLCKSRAFKGGLEIGLSRPEQNLDAFAAIFNEELSNL